MPTAFGGHDDGIRNRSSRWAAGQTPSGGGTSQLYPAPSDQGLADVYHRNFDGPVHRPRNGGDHRVDDQHQDEKASDRRVTLDSQWLAQELGPVQQFQDREMGKVGAET